VVDRKRFIDYHQLKCFILTYTKKPIYILEKWEATVERHAQIKLL